MENSKGTSTNQNGLGSTYAGTQTPDDKAPDGYQKPTAAEAEEGNEAKDSGKQKELGKEYDSQSSYGDKESKPDEKGVEGTESNSEEGSPIR